MIKSKTSLLALAVLAAVAITASQARAATYTAGDLILGFRATGGVGSGKNVLVDIGQAYTFRDLNGANSLNIISIGSTLSSAFGATWYDRTDLFFGVVAARTNVGGATVNGDPARTIYASSSRAGVGTLNTANSVDPSDGAMSLTNIAGAAGAMVSLGGTTFTSATADTGTLGKVTTIDSTTGKAISDNSGGGNTWTTYAPDLPSFIGIPQSVEQSFGSGYFGGGAGTFGAATNVEGALDLFRIGYVSNTAASYETTIVIDHSGNVSAVAAVPEPSTYAMFGLGAAVVAFVIRRRQLNA